MKLTHLAALALLAGATASASAAAVFTLDFEKTWAYGSDVNGYYAGGTADDGSSGANLGVSFIGVSGLSNDDPAFPFYSGAPSAQGVAYAHTFAPADRAYMNLANGYSGTLEFHYASATDAVGAVKAYSGLNGTGDLLGTLDLVANNVSGYDTWSVASLGFKGVAMSFDLTGSANAVALDNVSAVPEPSSALLLLAGGVALLSARRRRA